MHDARLAGDAEFAIWGSGRPRREFLHADDFGEATCVLLDQYSDDEPVNIGCGEDQTIAELAEMVRDTVGFTGALNFDTSKPDGMPRKLLDSTKLRGFGWTPAISLADGLRSTYRWYLSQCAR
jgi:GDP-L-fucose synthase